MSRLLEAQKWGMFLMLLKLKRWHDDKDLMLQTW